MPKKTASKEVEATDSNDFAEKTLSDIPVIEITKVKVTKEETLDVEYNEHINDDTINEVSKKCDNLVHEDLKTAFAQMKPYFALICDLRESAGLNPHKYNPEKLDAVEVTGFTLTDGEAPGVTLIGKKKIGDKVMNLVAPFTKFEDDNDTFKYGADLIDFDGAENNEEDGR